MKHEPDRAMFHNPTNAHELLDLSRSRRYLLVSPCRDEAQYLRRTLDSVALQSVPPALWIVVDDGSTDETPAILEEYSKRLPYLRVIRRDDRGGRKVGPGVIEAFYAGLEHVRLEDFDYVCKLDMDLDLPVRYFEILMERMEANPRIGTTSGKPWFVHPRSGALVPEICGDEMSVGMTKFYRIACFKEIGGFVRQVMWDGIDCHRARMLGWIAESVDLEPVRFLHLRPMGTSHKGIWTGRLRFGFGQYFMGTSPIYYLAVMIYRMPAYPMVIGSAAMLWGYFRSWLKGLPRYDDLEFRRFLRSYQHTCLRIGKRAATARVNAEQASLWHDRHPTPEAVASSSTRESVYFLDCRFDTGSIEEAASNILAETPGRFKYVVTPNVYHMVRMLKDPSTLQPLYDQAWRTFCDSRVLSCLAWFSGLRLPVITGSDLTAHIIARAGQQRLKIAIIGPTAAACVALERKYPGLTVMVHTPPMGFITSEAEIQRCIDFVVNTQSPLTFLALGTPQQETLALRLAQHPQAAGVGLCIGASIDFLTGKQHRAPAWMQKAGLEWLHRLISDPRRLASRYLIESPSIFYLMWSKRKKGA